MAKDKLFSHGPLAAWIFSDKAEGKKKKKVKEAGGGEGEKKRGKGKRSVNIKLLKRLF